MIVGVVKKSVVEANLVSPSFSSLPLAIVAEWKWALMMSFNLVFESMDTTFYRFFFHKISSLLMLMKMFEIVFNLSVDYFSVSLVFLSLCCTPEARLTWDLDDIWDLTPDTWHTECVWKDGIHPVQYFLHTLIRKIRFWISSCKLQFMMILAGWVFFPSFAFLINWQCCNTNWWQPSRK